MANTETRVIWLESLWASYDARTASVEDLLTVIDRIVTEGPAMGKTFRWQAAVRWYADELADARANGKGEDIRTLNWIVGQGSVWLAHAA